MTVLKLTVDPGQSIEEEEALVARAVAAYAESGGLDEVDVQVDRSEQVTMSGAVADRMGHSARWGA